MEEVLSRHPAVAIAAALGQPDALKGELPIAYVQLRASATPEELLSLCRDDVAERAAVPIEVVIIDAIPVTAVGKIFKPALRLDAMARSVRRTVADTVGADHAVTIDVQETATRPAARLGVPPGADAERLALLLRDAFIGFMFDTVITIRL